MQSLGLFGSALVAIAVVPALVSSLRERGLVRPNYRGRMVAHPIGVAIPVCGLVALAPLAAVQRIAGVEIFNPAVYPSVLYVVGVALLGLVDDMLGGGGAAPEHERDSVAGAPRGWRGHARATLRGRFSTGAVKATGSLGLALFALSGERRTVAGYLLAAAVLVVATNLFNLLDLRPGRSAKALLLVGCALSLGALDVHGLLTVGIFLGPVLMLLPLDLRERGMLGDTGANAVGALAGVWLISTLSTSGQAVALALMAALSVYGEFRSLSALIERTPAIRHLDSLGRISHA